MQKYTTGFKSVLPFISLILLVGVFTAHRHPFYLGVTEVAYNSKSQLLEISIKLFTDDFEKCLASQFKKPVNLYAQNVSNQVDSLVETYIKLHFKMYDQNKIFNLHYLGFEKSEEATWTYFELPLSSPPSSLQIQNSLLYDCIHEQSNIMHFKISSKNSSYKLNYPDSSYQWKFTEY